MYSFIFGFSKISRHFIIPQVQHNFPTVVYGIFHFCDFFCVVVVFLLALMLLFSIISLESPYSSFKITGHIEVATQAFACSFPICVAALCSGRSDHSTLLQRWTFIIKSQRS